MKKLIILLLVLASMVGSNVALALDTSDALYTGIIRITNNGTATTNVSVPFTANTSIFINAGYMNNTANNTAVTSGSGANLPFMPGFDNGTWIIDVPSISADSIIQDTLFMGGATDMEGKLRYFPGDGGMAVPDDATLELGDNFTITLSGYINTSTPDEQTDSFYSSSSDGFLTGRNAAYATAQALAVATSLDATSNFTTLGQDNGDLYRVFRGFLYFDTSSIPPGANIVDATLKLYGSFDGSTTNEFDVVVTNGQPTYPSDPLALADFDKTHFSNNGGQIDTTPGWSTSGYNSISLNATGISFIDQGGLTKLTIRSSRDIAGTGEGGGGNATISYYTSEAAGTSYDPILEVTYTHKTLFNKANAIKSYIAGSGNITVSIFDGSGMIDASVATGVSSGETTFEAGMDDSFLWLSVDNTATIPFTNDMELNLPFWSRYLQGTSLTSVDSNEYTATVTGATYGTQGRTFDGTDYISNTDADIRSADSQGAIGVWFKTSGVAGTYQTLVSSSDTALNTKLLTFNILDSTGALSVLQRNADVTDRIDATTDVVDGEWHYAILSSNGSAYTINLDGVDEGLSVSGGANNGDWFADTSDRDNLTFGVRIRTDITQYFTGTIGEVQIYSNAPSEPERSQNYEATKEKYIGTSAPANFEYIYSTASVPDNTNDWVFFENNVMPYVEAANITKGGILAGYWEWEYGATFTDGSGNGNTATPTFRTTSSDADVSAELVSFSPVTEAKAPAFSVNITTSGWITAEDTQAGNFTTTSVNSTYPGSDVLEAVTAGTDTPSYVLEIIIGGVIILCLSLLISHFMRNNREGSLLLKILVVAAGIGVLIALRVLDNWLLYIFLFIAIAIAMAASQRTFTGTGNSGNNMVGFLTMGFVGMTTINRILEGRFLQATDVTTIRNVLAFQPFEVFGIFTIPVPNTNFLLQGLPALMRWDYSFFGGNAQIFQYLLYSVTGVVSFMLLVLVFGAVYQMFSRGR